MQCWDNNMPTIEVDSVMYFLIDTWVSPNLDIITMWVTRNKKHLSHYQRYKADGM